MTASTASFSVYLAQLLLAREGYELGTVPEAEALTHACDNVLTRADGMTLSMVCLVDAEADPTRTFGASRDELLRIGSACKEKYSGRINGVRQPVSISVVVVRAQVPEPEQHALDGLASRTGTVIRPYLVDVGAKAVHRGIRFLVDARRRMIQKALTSPRLTPQEMNAAASVAVTAQVARPVLTYAMLAVFAAVFVLELRVTVSPPVGFFEPSGATLIALGGLLGSAVKEGETYRLVTAAFLHASPLHLLFNGFAFWMGALFLESLLGRAWLLAVFFVSAVGGSLLSMALNGEHGLSVGASGAIMGLLATVGVIAFRLPAGPERSQGQMVALRVLVPSLLPITGMGSGGARVDIACHLGGALAGGALAFVLLKAWRVDRPEVPWKALAAVLAVAGVAVTGWGSVALARELPSARLAMALIPGEEVPKTDEEIAAKAQGLVAKYPQDPRAHLFNASRLRDARDLPGSDEELRQALRLAALTRRFFKPDLEWLVRRELAKSLLEQGLRDDARQIAGPVCGHPPADQPLLGLELCP